MAGAEDRGAGCAPGRGYLSPKGGVDSAVGRHGGELRLESLVCQEGSDSEAPQRTAGPGTAEGAHSPAGRADAAVQTRESTLETLLAAQCAGEGGKLSLDEINGLADTDALSHVPVFGPGTGTLQDGSSQQVRLLAYGAAGGASHYQQFLSQYGATGSASQRLLRSGRPDGGPLAQAIGGGGGRCAASVFTLDQIVQEVQMSHI